MACWQMARAISAAPVTTACVHACSELQRLLQPNYSRPRAALVVQRLSQPTSRGYASLSRTDAPAKPFRGAAHRGTGSGARRLRGPRYPAGTSCQPAPRPRCNPTALTNTSTADAPPLLSLSSWPPSPFAPSRSAALPRSPLASDAPSYSPPHTHTQTRRPCCPSSRPAPLALELGSALAPALTPRDLQDGAGGRLSGYGFDTPRATQVRQWVCGTWPRVARALPAAVRQRTRPCRPIPLQDSQLPSPPPPKSTRTTAP